MLTIHSALMFIHVLAVIVWIGGLATLAMIDLRLARERDPTGMRAFGRANAFVGRAVVGPAAGLAVLAGIALSVKEDISFATFWIDWALGGVAISLLMGATLLRRIGNRLAGAVEVDAVGERVSALRRRQLALEAMNLLVLLSILWVMIFQPTL